MMITALLIASIIVLNPVSAPCFFVWKVNYSDSSNLIVGDDYIEHGGLKVYVSSSEPIEFDIVAWNPNAKTVDGAVVIDIVAIYSKEAQFAMTISGLAPKKEYTIFVDDNPTKVYKSDESGSIEFVGSVGSSHRYTIVTGNQTEAIGVVYVAPTEKGTVERVIEEIKYNWLCTLLLLALLILLLLLWLRSSR